MEKIKKYFVEADALDNQGVVKVIKISPPGFKNTIECVLNDKSSIGSNNFGRCTLIDDNGDVVIVSDPFKNFGSVFIFRRDQVHGIFYLDEEIRSVTSVDFGDQLIFNEDQTHVMITSKGDVGDKDVTNFNIISLSEGHVCSIGNIPKSSVFLVQEFISVSDNGNIVTMKGLLEVSGLEEIFSFHKYKDKWVLLTDDSIARSFNTYSSKDQEDITNP